MMMRIRATTISLVAAAVAAVATGAAAQGPGEVPVAGTYQGSMEQQRRDAEAAAQVQAQNQAMLQRLDEDYKYYAPGGTGAGGGRGGAQAPPLTSKPLLPAAKNPLLGRWQQTGAKPLNLGLLSQMPGANIAESALAGGCQSIFGKAGVAFTPTQLNWVAPDGREEILNRVEYRSDGANIIVIPTDADLPLIFGMPDRDHVVVAFLGCTMRRLAPTAKPVSYTAAPPPPPGARAAAAPAAEAVLNLTVGEMNAGKLSAPPAGTRIFLTNQNPDTNLVRAGFAPDAGGQPIDKLFAACRVGQGGTQESCNRGMAALTTGAVAVAITDSSGQATAGVPPGRYYLVSFTPYKGRSLIWHLPVDLRPGANAVTLSPQNGSLSP